MIRYLLEKEFRQIIRNPFLPRLIFIFPCLTLLLMPWAANYEVRNINLSIVDNNSSGYSHRLVHKIISSGFFRLTDTSAAYKQALKSIESGESDIILEIPAGFESSLIREKRVRVSISADAVNSTKGNLGSSYLISIINDFVSETLNNRVYNPEIKVIRQYLFNPYLNYKVFMVPALMVMLLTMLCGFLPALNIVGEKEAGTMEQINVTPVKKSVFILSKLIPYWIIGFIVLTIGFSIAFFIYGILPAGRFATIYMFAAVYILVVSGFGLVISNYSRTMQQAMFVMYFFILVFILISGLFTPVASMPGWARIITVLNPLKYFINVMRSVYLKGSGFADLLKEFYALLFFAFFFNAWAVLSYRKNN